MRLAIGNKGNVVRWHRIPNFYTEAQHVVLGIAQTVPLANKNMLLLRKGKAVSILPVLAPDWSILSKGNSSVGLL